MNLFKGGLPLASKRVVRKAPSDISKYGIRKIVTLVLK
ncbi:hypothetical protein JOD43_004408 [Pullulanibacillus pueri]|nr:hypothetical protein [Pullulanibacillus pueri]